MSSDTGPGPEREEAIRRLLAEAVEPVEPGPGAQTRLLARARAQQRRRRRPLAARWALPAALASVLIVLGVTVIFATRGGDGSGSSASTTAGSAAAGGPSRAASAEASAAAGGATVPAPVAPAPSKSLDARNGASSLYGSAQVQTGTKDANRHDLSFQPSDFDGDGRPDTFTLGAGTLAVQLSSLGLETVSLPPLGPGAKILGTSLLTDPHGQLVPVVFVRLRQVGTSSTDTVAVLENGSLEVVQQGSGPVLLTIDPTHGYGCAQMTLALAGNTTPFVVSGAQLVASPHVRGLITPAGKAVGCF